MVIVKDLDDRLSSKGFLWLDKDKREYGTTIVELISVREALASC